MSRLKKEEHKVSFETSDVSQRNETSEPTVFWMHNEQLAKVFPKQAGFLSLLPVLLGNKGLQEPASSLAGCYVWHISSHI